MPFAKRNMIGFDKQWLYTKIETRYAIQDVPLVWIVVIPAQSDAR